jgi:hypothetical protein
MQHSHAGHTDEHIGKNLWSTIPWLPAVWLVQGEPKYGLTVTMQPAKPWVWVQMVCLVNKLMVEGRLDLAENTL